MATCAAATSSRGSATGQDRPHHRRRGQRHRRAVRRDARAARRLLPGRVRPRDGARLRGAGSPASRTARSRCARSPRAPDHRPRGGERDAVRYALLIYGDETSGRRHRPTACRRWSTSTGPTRRGSPSAGMKRGGEALWPDRPGHDVRVRDGEVLTTRTDRSRRPRSSSAASTWSSASNLDEAIEAARAVPGRRARLVEVRPVVDISAFEGGRRRADHRRGRRPRSSGASRGGRSRR